MTRGHDSMPEPPLTAPGVPRLRIDPNWGSTGQVKLRATPGLAREILAQLKEQGADVSYGAEFGIDLGDLLLVVLGMRDSGAWMTLRTAIEAVASRHQGARFRLELGDRAVEIEGKSTADMQALLTQAQEIWAADAEHWRRMNSDDPADPQQ